MARTTDRDRRGPGAAAIARARGSVHCVARLCSRPATDSEPLRGEFPAATLARAAEAPTVRNSTASAHLNRSSTDTTRKTAELGYEQQRRPSLLLARSDDARR